jgi:hypothetical protein
MKIGRRKIYWDTACWLAWLNGEGTDVWPKSVVDGIQEVVDEVEDNKAVLFTSTITRGEIYQGRLTQMQKDKYAALMRRSNVREIDPGPRIMDRVSQIREYHDNENPKRKIKTPDGTHLATAIIYGADEFQTMDGLQKGGGSRKLLALSGNVGGYDLKVVHPYPRSTPPPELVTVKGPLFGSEEKIDEES